MRRELVKKSVKQQDINMFAFFIFLFDFILFFNSEPSGTCFTTFKNSMKSKIICFRHSHII